MSALAENILHKLMLATWPSHSRMVSEELIIRSAAAVASREKFQSANAKAAARRVLRSAQLQAVANHLRNESATYLETLESELADIVRSLGVGDLDRLFAKTSRTIDKWFSNIESKIGLGLKRVAKSAARKAVESAEQHHGEPVGHGPIKEPPVMGATLQEHIEKLANDFDFKFRAAIRQGKAAGESLDEIIERFTGNVTSPVTASEVIKADKEIDEPNPNPNKSLKVRIADASKASLDRLLSAAVHAFSHEGESAVDTSASEKEMGWEWLGILDDRICERCEFYAGNRWTRDYEPVGDAPEFPEDPPLHPNCRCAVVLTNLAEEGAPDASFDDYLAQFSRTEQEQAFGKSALRAYHRGDITAGQLVAQQNHALSIDEFEEAAA